jgi:hypothetical protein
VLSPVDGAFDAADVHVAEGSLDHASATFHAASNGAH